MRRQDLTQDIWLAVWQALPRFRGECSERTFVFRIAHNRAASHVAHWAIRRTEPLETGSPLPSGIPCPEGVLNDQERRERLQAAVRRLAPRLRQVVVLSLEGLSHREVADVLGISAANVAVRLSRARAILAQDLAGKEPR
jgi:RNA polymerase sigma-70 factor (ECF subfamily)